MKKLLFAVLIAALLAATACTADSNSSGSPTAAKPTPSSSPAAAIPTPSAVAANEMAVTSSGIKDGYIDPAYGAKGDVKAGGITVLSLPLEITGAPEGTACFAVCMDDPDAKPLCGYNWVHWMAANINEGSIPEDFSRTAQDKAVQGQNDNGTAGYAGPAPPDKDHTYVITVYALDAALTLPEGFSKAEFAQALQGHVLASATLTGIYKK